jgi:uncharacterized protein
MTMRERSDDARALDLRLLCRDGATRQGRWPLASLQRLCSGLCGPLPAGAEVAWSAAGLLRPVAGGEAEHWLHLQARAEVPLQCQRCLQAISEPLVVDRRFRFVQGEAEAERLDEELEDDVLALPALLDLQALLEDELILGLPLVPRHDGPCPEPLPLPAEEPGLDVADEHPFAALAALRGRAPAGGNG